MSIQRRQHAHRGELRGTWSARGDCQSVQIRDLPYYFPKRFSDW